MERQKQYPPTHLKERYDARRKKEEIKTTEMHNNGFDIVIDGEKHTVSEQFISGKQIKILAGITEKDEQFALAEYHEFKGEKGWFAYIKDDDKGPLFDNDEIDITEHSELYTTCVGNRVLGSRILNTV